MLNHHTTELFITDLEVPLENLVGEEGAGFRYIIDGWNAERIPIASEPGDGRWFVERATKYAPELVVFGRPIGANQGVQFPIAQAHARLEAADLVRHKAAWLFDSGSAVAPKRTWPSCWPVRPGTRPMPVWIRMGVRVRGGVRRGAQVP
jgi:acyl-CoA dehydrogenase